MKKTIPNIGNFYKEDFQNMMPGCTVGFFLFLKLVVMFFIPNMGFLPNYLRQNAIDREKNVYVATGPIGRSLHPCTIFLLHT
ncbi:MAG: DUF4492 domain-containing protein [Bacteroides sp.]|nr:DUF4492 domain-containing protein [Bacteroides sp.]